MALPSALTGITVSTRKLAAATLLVLSTFALWFWTRSGLLACVLLLLGSAAAAVAMHLAARRRITAALARAQQVRAHRDHLLADISAHLDLDRRLVAALMTPHGQGAGPAPRIDRMPMRPGNSSHFLNRVDVSGPGGAPLELVEKVVDGDCNERRFWGDRRGGLVLRAATFRSLEPVAVIDGGAMSVLYFPYIRALDREQLELRRTFRANLVPIAAAVAEFNGRNLVTAESSHPGQPNGIGHFIPARPAVDELQRRLSISRRDARELLRHRDEVEARWTDVRAAYERLPRCLCHYDVSPGNTVHADGVTMLADFGLAAVGPVGSDLHTLIRWSGRSVAEPGHTDSLLEGYHESIRHYARDVTLDDLVLSAWTTYYLRYTSLRLPSARHRHAYTLALRRMEELIARYG